MNTVRAASERTMPPSTVEFVLYIILIHEIEVEA
jgi:hypothetical protein